MTFSPKFVILASINGFPGQFANSVLAKVLYIRICTLQVDYNIWLRQNPNKTNFWGKKSLQELKNTRHSCALQKNKLSPRFQLLNLRLFCNFAIYRANYSKKHQNKSEIFLLWYCPYCWCNSLFGFFLFHGLGRHIMQSLEDFQVDPHRGHLCCRGCHANRKESWVETSLRFFQRLFLLLRFVKNRPRRNCKVWKCEALDFFPHGFSS